LPDARTGAHKDYGFFLAVGEGIRHLDDSEELREVYNWDVAPTALHIMGEPIPADMDGEPMFDIFEGPIDKEQVA
jgi:arylsulfatase A-like enzyme